MLGSAIAVASIIPHIINFAFSFLFLIIFKKYSAENKTAKTMALLLNVLIMINNIHNIFFMLGLFSIYM